MRPLDVLYGAGSLTNFSELRKGEVRRITIPRTPVNKGKKSREKAED
jgi:hypothetical protein